MFYPSFSLCANFVLAGATFYPNAYFVRGTGGIYLDNVGCRGSESRLIDCYHNVIGVHNCDHSDDAGIRCRGKAKKIRTWKIVVSSNITRAFFHCMIELFFLQLVGLLVFMDTFD